MRRSAKGVMAGWLGALAGVFLSGSAVALDSVRWEYRPLLIFTPSGTDARLSRQTTRLADAAAGLTDRRLAVYIVERSRVFTTFGAPATGVSAKGLRRRFRVPDDAFKVVLVGLDGGAKLSVDAPITTQRLFAVIDGMPMRRRELRERAAR
ncbi:MAG: DUF4174 domain-containing protein [Pseudomonadota bacterium]